MKTLRIAIIGAGIGGLVAARAMQLAGFRPRLFERASHLQEVGAGLTIPPNAAHGLNGIGLGESLHQYAKQPGRGGVKHWQSGELKVALNRGEEMVERFGAPYLHIHRADLHNSLVAQVLAADPDAIELSSRFTDLTQDDAGVDIHFADGKHKRADLVIGADGLRSNVRATLFGDEQPRFTGYIAFRGLVPVTSLPHVSMDPPSCLSTGPDRSFARYLIRDGNTLNFVGLAQREGWQEEGWSIPATIDEMLSEYQGWHEDVLTIIRNTPPGQLFKWALFDREPLAQWTVNRVTLLGDAAHPMLPFLGSGASMAIEDGVVLGRALAVSSSIDEALQRYAAARHERTTWVMLQSRRAAAAYHSGHDENYQPSKHITAESLGIWAYDPTKVDV